MAVESGHAHLENNTAAAVEPPAEPLPEVEAYAYLLALVHLLDRKQAAEVCMHQAAGVATLYIRHSTLQVL